MVCDAACEGLWDFLWLIWAVMGSVMWHRTISIDSTFITLCLWRAFICMGSSPVMLLEGCRDSMFIFVPKPRTYINNARQEDCALLYTGIPLLFIHTIYYGQMFTMHCHIHFTSRLTAHDGTTLWIFNGIIICIICTWWNIISCSEKLSSIDLFLFIVVVGWYDLLKTWWCPTIKGFVGEKDFKFFSLFYKELVR